MSWVATAQVKALRKAHGIDRTEKLTLMCLADYHNDETGACFPSIARLAEDSLLSQRHLTRVLQQLEQKGFVEIERHEGRSSNYLLHLTPDTMSPLTCMSGDIAMSPTPDILGMTPDMVSPTPDIAMSPITVKEPEIYNRKEPKGISLAAILEQRQKNKRRFPSRRFA